MDTVILSQIVIKFDQCVFILYLRIHIGGEILTCLSYVNTELTPNSLYKSLECKIHSQRVMISFL